jgi:hypothetical protein
VSADDAGHLDRVDSPVGVDADDADVEFARERPVCPRDCPRRRRDVPRIGLVEPVVRLDDAPLDVDRPALGVAFRLDCHEGRLVADPLDGEQFRLDCPDAHEVGVPRSQADVVERCEPFADVRGDGLAGEPLLDRELRVRDRVRVRLLREEAPFRPREDPGLGE